MYPASEQVATGPKEKGRDERNGKNERDPFTGSGRLQSHAHEIQCRAENRQKDQQPTDNHSLVLKRVACGNEHQQDESAADHIHWQEVVRCPRDTRKAPEQIRTQKEKSSE